MQGYIHPYHDEWVTTTAGEDVAGARPPRFSPEKVEEALAELRERIKAVNLNSKSPYKITEAVVFGDFLQQKIHEGATCPGWDSAGAAEGEARGIPGETTRGRACVFETTTREGGDE